MLAVAPEIDLKYETLFAYLNNDITRKWPTLVWRCGRARGRHEQAGSAPLPVAGSQAFRQRTAAGRCHRRRSPLMACDGFCGGAAGLPVSREYAPSLDPQPGIVRRATGRHRSIGSAFRSHAISKSRCRLLASLLDRRRMLAGGHSGRGPGRRAGAGRGSVVPGAGRDRPCCASISTACVRAGENTGELITGAVVATAVARRGAVSWRV